MAFCSAFLNRVLFYSFERKGGRLGGGGVGDKCVMSVLHKKVRKRGVAGCCCWKFLTDLRLGLPARDPECFNSFIPNWSFWKPSLGSRSASSFFTLDSFDTLLHQRVCETVVGQNICPGAERWPNRLPQRTASAHIHTISFMYQMDWERGSRVRQRSGREKKSVSLLPYTIAVCAGRGCRGPLASIIGFSFKTFFSPRLPVRRRLPHLFYIIRGMKAEMAPDTGDLYF